MLRYFQVDIPVNINLSNETQNYWFLSLFKLKMFSHSCYIFKYRSPFIVSKTVCKLFYKIIREFLQFN